MASIKEKRLLLGFIMSRGGRVTSGRNASVLRWAHGLCARQGYHHERIGELEEVFEALEADGDLVLERDERGKLFAAHISEQMDSEHADLTSDMFQGLDELWALLVTMMATNTRLRTELWSTDVVIALELAEQAEHDRDEALRQLAEANSRVREMEEQAGAGLAARVAELESELRSTRAELDAHKGRVESIQQVFDLAKADWLAEKKGLRNRLSQFGGDKAALEREVRLFNQTFRPLQEVLLELAELVRGNGIAPSEKALKLLREVIGATQS